MRVVAIIGALLVGLVGLFMSVCGGGLFLALGYTTVKNLFASGSHNQIGGVVFLVIPVICAVIGVVLCWLAFKFISGQLGRKTDGDR